MSFLVDTNVLSELGRPSPNAGVVEWADRLGRIAVSVVTVEEVFYGLTLKPSARIQRWLESFFESHCQTLDVSPAIARHAGILRGQLAARGRVRTQADMLIAATAALHGLTLATRNVEDFEDCGIAVMNPFR